MRNPMAIELIPDGARIRKVFSEENDAHPVGSQGVVLSSCPYEAMVNGRLIRAGYFVLWDDFPLPVFVVDFKIAPVMNA